MKKCSVCQAEIPEGRLRILPNTKTCVQHSDAARYTGHIVSQGDAEAGESFQEFDVIRDSDTARQYEHYKSQVGSYR